LRVRNRPGTSMAGHSQPVLGMQPGRCGRAGTIRQAKQQHLNMNMGPDIRLVSEIHSWNSEKGKVTRRGHVRLIASPRELGSCRQQTERLGFRSRTDLSAGGHRTSRPELSTNATTSPLPIEMCQYLSRNSGLVDRSPGAARQLVRLSVNG